MPTLHIRAVRSELMERLKRSASMAKEPVDQHAIGLIETALDVREARRQGGEARARNMTAEQRRASAQKAGAVRWEKERTEG